MISTLRSQSILSLSQSLLLCLLIRPSVARPKPQNSLWHIDIFRGPAPSPQDGPPASANANRNRADLPIEVGSILGAYVVFVIFIGIGIFTVGRRLRRSAQTSPKTLNMDMVKPAPPQASKAFDPSPISPSKSQFSPYSPSRSRFWPSPKPGHGWASLNKHSRQGSMQSSVITFDDTVIEDDKNKNEIEMDRLYAAVAEHETKKERGSQASAPLSPLAQHPPELQHLRHGPPPAQFPLSPPPDQQHFAESRTSTTSPRRITKPSPISIAGTNPPSRNSSRSSFASFTSFGKKRGTNIRALPISPPMGSPDMAPSRNYGDTEPLSPRHYTPGPPPTPPHHRDVLASPYFAPSIRSSRGSNGALSPPLQTPRSATFGPLSPVPKIVEEYVQPSSSSTDESPNATPTASTAPNLDARSTPKGKKPTPLTLKNSNDSSGTLALRTAPLPLRALRSPRSTRPPSMIKATEITRPDTNRLRAPGSAMMPQTPYSPFYMPQTPLTPMTPSRLVTREERKAAKKAEGRRVLTQDDAVIEEDEMFGGAY